MGSMHAAEYASMKGKNKDMGLLAHLQGNHYPPVPASMLGPSKRAISAVNRGKHDSNIKLPQGVMYIRARKQHQHLQLLKHTTYMRG
jgi:hypothetical protein